MLSGRAADIKRHKWFEGMDWEALSNRRVEPGRKPREDSAKRLKELMVRHDLLTAVPAVFLLVIICIKQRSPDQAQHEPNEATKDSSSVASEP